MTLTLKTGGKIDLPDLKAVEKEIEDTERQLAKLRRLRKVVAEMTGGEDADPDDTK